MTKEKKQKKQGPIRTGAVVPFVVFVVLITIFNIFFLDSTVKSAMEVIGTKLNNAEVNVGRVESRFMELDFKVHNIQITKYEEPSLNAISVGKIEFKMMWDALLRGKVVIDLAQVADVKVNTKRKYPGKVYPIQADAESETEKEAKKFLEKTSKEFEGNVFGDIAGVLSGGSTGDISKSIEGNLASKKRLEEIKVDLEKRKNDLDKQVKNLPTQADFKGFEKRFNSVKKGFKKIQNIPKALKEADKLNKDINKAVKKYEKLNKDLNAGLKEVNNNYKEVDKLVKQDMEDIKKRMKIPSLDQSSIAKVLFGPEVLDKVELAKSYQKKIKKYMPPKKEKDPEPITPPRGEGRNYRFGTPNSYPLFWLKLAKINSENDQGEVKGTLTNVTTNQSQINKTTDLKIKANFPKEKIENIKINMAIDTREELMASLRGEVGRFEVNNKMLSKSSDVTFGLERSLAHSKFKGKLTSEGMTMLIDTNFNQIDYKVDSKDKNVLTVLNDVAKRNKSLSLDADVSGKWNDLKFDIKSNLASAIERSVKAVIKEKIAKMENDIKKGIDKEIAGLRSEIDNSMKGIKSQIDKEVNKGKAQIAKAKKDLKNAEKNATKSISNPFKNIKL